VRIDILGTLVVTIDAGPHQIQANKVRAMLATLALDAGRAISHEELADELWSGDPPAGALNALQAHATRIRRVLDGPDRPRGAGSVLRSVRNGYLLDIPPESVDGTRFRELAGRGAAALAERPEHALELLSAGLALWRGPALIDAGDGLRCRSAAVSFDECRLTMWEDLISARLATGAERPAITELRALVAQYPLRERFSEQLMLALYRAGRQSEALEVFHRTRVRLAEELGLRPGAALQRRHAEILAHDVRGTVLAGHRAPTAAG
jgi:DNA-binding SARP family transcriptional activator